VAPNMVPAYVGYLSINPLTGTTRAWIMGHRRDLGRRAARLPGPVAAAQILWVNLVTDILPAVALIHDPAEPDIMRRPPRDPRQALNTWRFGGRVLAEGALLAAGVLSAYSWAVLQDGVGTRANTMAFVALVLVHPLQRGVHRRRRLDSRWLQPGRTRATSRFLRGRPRGRSGRRHRRPG
jgi:hypothetical protein